MRRVVRAFSALHRGLYRLSGGKLGASTGKMPVLLLTTTGRKSGQPRTWPVGYIRDGDRLVISASAGGEPAHPAWYLNLTAQPRVTVQLGQATTPMDAVAATGAERARLWSRLVGDFPVFADYEKRTAREIPVVILTKATG
jgi:deazaflavin-dependent oxidoreductase (nitroreductase family)